MRIGVFGCSWSRGMPYLCNHGNWVLELSKIKPDWQFVNFATNGTCANFSLHNYYISKGNFDFVIFQGSSVGRLTHIPPTWDPYSHIVKPTDNYRETIEKKWIKGIVTNQLKRPNDGYYKEMYKKYPYWTETLISNYSLMDSVGNLFFTHRNRDANLYKDYTGKTVLSIEGLVGAESFKEYVEDDGGHFGLTGQKIQAKLIGDIIDESN